MKQKDFKILINRYLEDKCTEEERIKIETAYLYQKDPEFPELRQEELEKDLQNISNSLSIPTPIFKKLNPWVKWSIAACLLLTTGIGIYSVQDSKDNTTTLELSKEEIMPGSDKAILTLSNGKKINITDLESGEISLQNGEGFQKNADGQITYLGKKKQEKEADMFSTLSTPRGGQYRIILPDGTKVWLNSESSITFPTKFAEDERRVEIEGEFYFEVAKNKTKPFKIKLNAMEIAVLGTSFNVSAYPTEKEISTTLFEGSVNVNAGVNSINLTPGRQAKYDKISGKVVDVLADLDAESGWKNGDFIFNERNIKSIMTDLARWYDVDVDYKGDTSNLNFSAKISRRSTIREVLEILQTTGTVQFKIEGRRVTVMI